MVIQLQIISDLSYTEATVQRLYGLFRLDNHGTSGHGGGVWFILIHQSGSSGGHPHKGGCSHKSS